MGFLESDYMTLIRQFLNFETRISRAAKIIKKYYKEFLIPKGKTDLGQTNIKIGTNCDKKYKLGLKN